MSAAAEEWTLATVRVAAETVVRARGLDVRAFFVGGTGTGALRIEVLREAAPGERAPDRQDVARMTDMPMPIDLDTREVTCWLELPCDQLDAVDAKPGAVTELVSLEVTKALRMRHGQGATA